MSMAVLSYLDAEHVERMSEYLCSALASCTVLEHMHPRDVFDEKEAAAGGQATLALWRRLNGVAPIPITLSLAFFTVALSTSWGDLVLWAYTLCLLSRRKGGAMLTLDDLVGAFPVGFPTPAECERLWKAQKCRCHG